jgi:hypothetical protein
MQGSENRKDIKRSKEAFQGGVTFYPNTPKYTQIQLQIILFLIWKTGTAMNAHASENYLAISRSSSASKSDDRLQMRVSLCGYFVS